MSASPAARARHDRRAPAPHHGVGPPPPEVVSHAHWATGVIAVVGGLGGILAPFVGTLGSIGCADSVNVLCSPVVFVLLIVGTMPALFVALVLAQRGAHRARPDGGHYWVNAAWSVWVGWCLVWWTLFLLVGNV